MNPLKNLYNRLPVNFRIGIRKLIPDPMLRSYARKNTDVYLISYPKCGRTWLRMMIAKAIVSHFGLPEDEDSLLLRWKDRPHPDVPRITVIHDDRPMLKSPEELEISKKEYCGKQVIFLVRDPRDVIVSSYFEMKNRGRMFGENPYEKHQAIFQGSLSEFIHSDHGGFSTILRYYNIWAENRDIPDGFLLVRYEDLKTDSQAQLRRIFDFMNLESIPDERLAEAVDFAAFDNMRKMEAGGKVQQRHPQAGGSGRSRNV